MNKIFASRQARMSWTLFVAIVSGLLFDLIHMPIPWLLGPMLGTLAVSKGIKSVPMFWPGSVRNAGLIIVGYSIGISFTLDTLKEIGRQLPSMALMTLLLLLLCLLIAILAARLTKIPFPTVLTGCIPGGLTQIVSLAEETKGIDVTIVTFLQATRLMMIVVFIPILAFSPLFGSVGDAAAGIGAPAVETVQSAAGALFPEIAVYAVLCTSCALIGQKIKFPTAFLLGPMIAAAILHISGMQGQPLPPVVMAASQLMIGCYVGLLLKPEKVKNKARLAAAAIGSGIVLVLGACGFSFLLSKLHAVSATTALLSLAPGGLDQMGIIAHALGADIIIVTCYQLFRTFFIFFAVPPLLRAIFAKYV